MAIGVKICGIKDFEALEASVEGGAAFVGFNFWPHSKRFIELDQAAKLVATVPRHVKTVGVFVDPTDDDLNRLFSRFSLDFVQFHGAETPEKAINLASQRGVGIIKTIGSGPNLDLFAISTFEPVADMLLFDTSVPGQSGGTGQTFDWNLLKGHKFTKPWFLAGGITINNLEDAVRITGARFVDVASGVEDSPGVKSPEKIRALLKRAITI